MSRTILFILCAVMMILSQAEAQIHFTAVMDSTQEVPAPSGNVPGKGTGSFSLNDARTELTYSITVTGLSGQINAAHFHNAAAGVAGPVVRSLSFNRNQASGVWRSTDASQPLTPALVLELLKGRLYINVHTSANPSGEIRGQVQLATNLGFSATIDSSQEIPTPTGNVPGKGSGWFWLNSSRTQLTYQITVNGLTGPINASHFHNGAAGVAGGVVKSISFTGNTSSGVWSSTDVTQPLTDSLVGELLRGRIYVNLHTSANPGGEIRGQVNLYSGIGFTASMDSVQEVPTPGGSVPGKGTGTCSLNDTRTELTYSITVTGLSGNINAGHFHNAIAGTSGPVVKGLTFVGNQATGVWRSTDASQPFTQAMLSELLRGRLYLNVHTTANPAGEIRGQVLLSTGVGFTAQMDSAQEVPAPGGNVAGKGTAWCVLNPTRTQLTFNITINGLSGPINAGHFHNAPIGIAGGVVRAIGFTNTTASGTWSSIDPSQALTDSMVSELLKGRLYLNVHTSANPSGEIRGQVGVGASTVTSVKQVSENVPATFTLDQNYPNPFNPSTSIRFQVPVAGRVALKVYNLLGQEVATLADEVKSSGTYVATFDGKGLASGVYFYRLQAGDLTVTKRLLLLK